MELLCLRRKMALVHLRKRASTSSDRRHTQAHGQHHTKAQAQTEHWIHDRMRAPDGYMSLLRRTERNGHTIRHCNWEKACWNIHRRSWAGYSTDMRATDVGWNNFRDPEQRSIRAMRPDLRALARSPRCAAHF